MAISLTSGIKNALTSLQNLQGDVEKTNQRLATGKRINSPLDGALNFFLADSFSSKARGLSTIQDGIGLGLNVLKQTDKALNSIKTSLEQAEGTLRAALNSAGTQAKITTNFTFRNAITGAADATQTFAEATTGTSANRLQQGDSFIVDLISYNAVGATANAGTITVTLGAGSTVQQVINALNTTSAAGFNPLAGGSPRVQAYLNDAGNLVIENQVGGGDAGTTNTYGIQIRVTQAAGATTNALDVFSISGAVGSSPRVTTVGAVQTVDITGGTTAQTTRAAAAASFREVLKQIRNTALDAGFNGTNLLQGDFLRTAFNEEGTTSITTQGRRTDAASLGFSEDVISGTSQIGDSARGFQGDREISNALTKIRTAKDSITSLQTTFAANSNLLVNRQEYTKQSVSNLNDGADLLTLADINEEGAALTSLQTRQQLSITALSLANQADQAILRLF
jgi:flagellin-like hook-associated protein FlgL